MVNKMKNQMLKTVSLAFIALLMSACGEEVLTQNTLSETYTAKDLESFHMNTCAAMRFVKPPVDILFVVDNSGSTLQDSFEQIKSQIASTVSTISNEFDYHVYIAPLHAGLDDNISNYPLVVSDVSSLTPPYTNYNLLELDHINEQTFFAEAGGNNTEKGFQRVYDVLNSNRTNGIFRDNANTIAVLISNGYDTDVNKKSSGRPVFDETAYNQKKQQFIDLAGGMSASSFRFISLVPHSNCNGWTTYGKYKKMSSDIYLQFAHGDDPSGHNSRDLCSGNYASLFSVVNESIRHELVGHKYDHWKISSSSESEIQANDIVVTKLLPDGSKVSIPESATNGFEYLGYKTNINTRYAPDAGEPVTGLVIKLNGDARVEYDEARQAPECIIAKTRTPTEYFGYVVLPREPQLGTIKIEINGVEVSNGTTNGWSYEGYKLDGNIKVEKNGASATPATRKTGYFIKLNGNAVFTNGDSVNVYYKPKAL